MFYLEFTETDDFGIKFALRYKRIVKLTLYHLLPSKRCRGLKLINQYAKRKHRGYNREHFPLQ